MRIAFSETCLEKVFNLPKEVQKNTLEFKRKFEQDSRMSSIHLEPIINFKDKNIRTARINQKYRAIVRVPGPGEDTYCIMWVDNHDDAMDWARNKMFEWNDKLQAVQVYVVPENIQNMEQGLDESESKLVPNLYDHYSDEQLLAIGVPQLLLPLVRQITDLSYLDHIEKQLPSEVYEHLFYLADGISIQTILNEIEEGKQGIDGFSSNNNRRHFIEVDDEVLEKYLNGELEKWQLFLHPSQRSLVEKNCNGSMKVTGGGGTGKTVVALHRLLFLTQQMPLSEKRPVLFSTYTKALRDNLDRLIKKMGVNSSRYELQNIDSLVWNLAKKYQIISNAVHILDMPGVKSSKELWEEIVSEELTEFDSKFLYDEFQQVILINNCHTANEYYNVSRIGRGKPITRKRKIEVWSLVEKYQERKTEKKYVDRLEVFNQVTDYLNANEIRPYAHLILDEIQDFSNVELRFIRALTEAKENDLFMVGDPYQNIYSRKPSFVKSGINIQGLRSKRLRINYRTTEEIKRLAVSSVKGITYDDFEGNPESLDGYVSLYHGEQPQYFCFATEQEQNTSLTEIVNSLLSSGEKATDILIGARTNSGIKELKKLLYAEKLAYYDLSEKSGIESGIQLSTFHGMKGLEFKHVILYGVNDKTVPFRFTQFELLEEEEKKQYFQSERSLMYVAMTRAVKQLTILGFGNKSEIIRI